MVSGYYNPEKTLSLFRNGWIVLGDMGSFDKDGYLYLHGRRNAHELVAHAARVNALHVEAVMDGKEGAEVSLATRFIGNNCNDRRIVQSGSHH